MKFLNKLVFYFYYEILFDFIKDEKQCENILNSFFISLNSFNKFYKIIIFIYQIFINLVAVIIRVISFLIKKKIQFNSIQNIKRLPFFKILIILFLQTFYSIIMTNFKNKLSDTIKVDNLIVGSGAGGSTTAHELLK